MNTGQAACSGAAQRATEGSKAARAHLTRQQARIRQETKAALPRVNIVQLCDVWHDHEYKADRIVRLSLSKFGTGEFWARIHPFEHRGKHLPPWSVCQPADMVRTDPPEWECIGCGREFYRHEMAETDACAECAQGIDYAEIEVR